MPRSASLVDLAQTGVIPQNNSTTDCFFYDPVVLETMAILVQAYDEHQHMLAPMPGHEILAYLMESSGRMAKDLLPILGTRGRISEILSGKRAISKEQAKRLATFFKVTADLFI